MGENNIHLKKYARIRRFLSILKFYGYKKGADMFPFSDEELQTPVELVIDKVRPTLTLDGGDITLLGIRDAKVYVRLEGACKGCPSSANTLKYAIENRLKEEIHPDIAIVHIPHGESF